MPRSQVALTFRIFRGERLVREQQLTQDVIKLGKVPSAHVQLEDETVSRMHAIVEAGSDAVHVIDLGSTRGTFVNGRRVHKARLESGDEIGLGATRIEVRIGAGGPARAEAPPPARAPAALGPAAEAVEVAALLGDSVVGVAHLFDPRGGRLRRATWALLGGGAACLCAAALAFAGAVRAAARDEAALAHHVRVLGKPAHSFRPRAASTAAEGIVIGGLAIGLAAVALGLGRARRERRDPRYRIGTAPGVDHPVVGAGADWPLVAPLGDGFALTLGAGVEGELIAEAATTPLRELVAQGRAVPSASVPGSPAIPIPAAGRIRARIGQTTFLVAGIARPRAVGWAPPTLSPRAGAGAYVAGSLVAHLAIVLLLRQVAIADAGISVDLAAHEPLGTVVRSAAQDPDAPLPPDATAPGSGALDAPGGPPAMALPEGAAGDPDRARSAGRLAVRDRGAPPELSREAAIEAAREAGVLGSARLRDAAALAGTADLESGFDRESAAGPLDGERGYGGPGAFGIGRRGAGAGGGCDVAPCGVAAGAYARLADGPGTGRGYAPWGGGGPRDRARLAIVPEVGDPVGPPDGALDPAIIRRYLKRHQGSIGYCYEKELLARPGLAGTALVQFLIAADGGVQGAVGRGFDERVASCVAKVIQAIRFPAPRGGGSVLVRYPFTFRAAGA